MASTDCPKWSGCNVPLCPLDPNVSQCRHLRGEPVCLWLRELAKEGGRAILEGILPEELVAAVVTAAPAIASRGTDLRRRLRRASSVGSKLAAGTALRQQHGKPKAPPAAKA
jgi:hypothetical protein